MDRLRYFEQAQIKEIQRPLLRAGDIVRVETKIKESDKTRLQTFEGTVLGIRGSGPSATFMVRRTVGNFGVERIFPLYSPLITKIDIIKRQKVRRARLTYLRQVGRRRFKEDVAAMQRHIKEEQNNKRLAEVKKKRLEAEQEKVEKEKDEVTETEPAATVIKEDAKDNSSDKYTSDQAKTEEINKPQDQGKAEKEAEKKD